MNMVRRFGIGAALALGVIGAQAQGAHPPPRPVVSKQPGVTTAPAQAYWYDGAVRRELAIDPDLVADFAPAGAAAAPGRPLITKSVAPAAASAGAMTSPLFRSIGAPASEARALPGGIIVTLRKAGSAAAANQALAPFGLRVSRQVDDSARRWVVTTKPGMAALETANRLHESGAFAAVTPDWWVSVTKK